MTGAKEIKLRRLGRTELWVSEIGFGAWGIGGATAGATSYGNTDDRTSRTALAAALDRGITFYDTSSVYGYGRSETLIGEVFAKQRERVVIATKAGLVRYDAPPDFSPAALRRSLSESLKRLQTGYIDLLQLHNPTPTLLAADSQIIATLDALCREGSIRAYGASAKTPADALAMIRDFNFPVVQLNLNMLDVRAVTSGVLAAATEARAGIIARTPLCFGFLGGGISAETIFAPEDHRSLWPRAQILRWIEAATEVLLAADAPPSQSPGQVALRYCLSYPAIASVIPGMLTAAEVEENAKAGAFGPLPPAIRARIEAINQERPSFLGTSGVDASPN
jgi:aryl-alcohol dehydrogenase-like predicted oxidoreductase